MLPIEVYSVYLKLVIILEQVGFLVSVHNVRVILKLVNEINACIIPAHKLHREPFDRNGIGLFIRIRSWFRGWFRCWYYGRRFRRNLRRG